MSGHTWTCTACGGSCVVRGRLQCPVCLGAGKLSHAMFRDPVIKRAQDQALIPVAAAFGRQFAAVLKGTQ